MGKYGQPAPFRGFQIKSPACRPVIDSGLQHPLQLRPCLLIIGKIVTKGYCLFQP